MPGETLYALTKQDRDRVAETVDHVLGQPQGRGRRGGERRLFEGATRGGVNISGGALVDMGIVWAYSYDGDTGLYQCKLPNHSSIIRFGILTGGSAIDAECEFLYEGIGTVLVDPAEFASVSEGDYLGPKASSQLAIPSFFPLMFVLDKITTGTERCVVEIQRDINVPPLLKTTGAASGGAISAKRVNESFAVVGHEQAFITES